MHDENNNEELFIMILNLKNIEKKSRKLLSTLRSKKISVKLAFNLYIRKFISCFDKRKKIFRNKCNRLKTRFIKSFINL